MTDNKDAGRRNTNGYRVQLKCSGGGNDADNGTVQFVTDKQSGMGAVLRFNKSRCGCRGEVLTSVLSGEAADAESCGTMLPRPLVEGADVVPDCPVDRRRTPWFWPSGRQAAEPYDFITNSECAALPSDSQRLLSPPPLSSSSSRYHSTIIVFVAPHTSSGLSIVF